MHQPRGILRGVSDDTTPRVRVGAVWARTMEIRCGRTVLPTTRCNYYTARCRHKPIIPHVLQHVVECSQ